MIFKLVVIFAFISLFLYHRRQQKWTREKIQRLDINLFEAEKILWNLQDQFIAASLVDVHRRARVVNKLAELKTAREATDDFR